MTVTGVRIPSGGYGVLPFPVGGGSSGLITPPPPVVPPPEGVDVVAMTASRTPQFATKEDAIKSAVSALLLTQIEATVNLGPLCCKSGQGTI
ncbi:hypothetical protein PbB2_01922 [Candidatus Phycosocius bacilliformis]|uniref:Uncharacterized protein n=1 Tax=Candidatus Phycosocius bacilliformis TaxID=1445552 RepID=A0A2P2EB13_9PROT|nr:hypothetical protein PbB2_01922 [Candidatus Phycosocius bacilliformis]